MVFGLSCCFVCLCIWLRRLDYSRVRLDLVVAGYLELHLAERRGGTLSVVLQSCHGAEEEGVATPLRGALRRYDVGHLHAPVVVSDKEFPREIFIIIYFCVDFLHFACMFQVFGLVLQCT